MLVWVLSPPVELVLVWTELSLPDVVTASLLPVSAKSSGVAQIVAPAATGVANSVVTANAAQMVRPREKTFMVQCSELAVARAEVAKRELQSLVTARRPSGLTERGARGCGAR